jgi:hypothetical protein
MCKNILHCQCIAINLKIKTLFIFIIITTFCFWSENLTTICSSKTRTRAYLNLVRENWRKQKNLKTLWKTLHSHPTTSLPQNRHSLISVSSINQWRFLLSTKKPPRKLCDRFVCNPRFFYFAFHFPFLTLTIHLFTLICSYHRLSFISAIAIFPEMISWIKLLLKVKMEVSFTHFTLQCFHRFIFFSFVNLV